MNVDLQQGLFSMEIDMTTQMMFRSADEFAGHLEELRRARRDRLKGTNRQPRKSLSRRQRQQVLDKTKSRCHICGETIAKGKPWAADHVFHHVHGGEHSVDNYLPAHARCNSYRWFFDSEEFQWILNLGVWFRTKIIQRDSEAIEFAEKFVKKEARRVGRRVKP